MVGEALETPFKAGEPAGIGVFTTNTVTSKDTRAIPNACEDSPKNSITGVEPEVTAFVSDNKVTKSKADHTKDSGIHVVRKVIKIIG